MLKAIIIDDEKRSRMALKLKLADHCPMVEVLGEAADGVEGLALIAALKPNLIFLDIEMPNMNGLQMAEALGLYNGSIVFTTAYNQYAIKAIKFSAFDYLLKPVDIEELKQTIERLLAVKKQAAETSPEQRFAQLETLVQAIVQKQEFMQRIAVHTLEAVHICEVSSITWLEASSNYTTLHFSNQPKLMASRTLRDFEEMLSPDQFVRVHHGAIINLNFVRRYLKGEGGQVEMKDGTLVDISRRRKENFLGKIRM